MRIHMVSICLCNVVGLNYFETELFERTGMTLQEEGRLFLTKRKFVKKYT